MGQKVYRGRIEFKQDADTTGEFRAEFATLNVIDHDGDVTVPGAFQDGQETLIEAWNHNYGQLPVGKGVIHEDEDKAVVEGHFFLDTQGGLEHYKTVKALGDLQEWSYTFDVEDSGYGEFDGQDVQFLRKLDVWGVAPVERGAGIDTRTTDIKGRKAALGSHSTATTDAAWDGSANEARARSGEDEAYYKRIFAWRDPDGDATVKSSYRFVHHMIAEGGAPGAANVRACQTAIGVLNGGRGGTTIPDGDRQGVWNHLAKHLRDADVEPPELKAVKGAGDSAGDGAEDGEGEAGDGDGKPSGVSPRDVQVQIDILKAQL